MPLLPQFSFSHEVSAATAKQDRLHVTIGDWTITGTTEGIDALRDRMGAPPQYARNGDAEAIMTIWGQLFKRPQQHGTSRPAVGVRSRTLQIGDTLFYPPVFKGHWSLKNYVSTSSVSSSTLSRLKLYLNPTRYVRNQSPITMPDTAPDSSWPEPRLFVREHAPSVNGEVVLNNNDNWVPNTLRWAAFTNPIRWRRHLRAYLNAVVAIFESELQRASLVDGQTAVWHRSHQNINLHESETYWEFSSDNPTALVANIKPLLDSFTARHREATVYRQDCDPSISHNALSLSAEINPGRFIRIYAKTNRRVRVEVIHKFGGVRGYAIAGGHTTDQWSHLPQMLECLAENAAELVNRMFAHFRNQRSLASSHIPSYQFLLELCHHSRDLPTATTIATLLVHNGSIAAGGAGERMQRALQRLSGAGVLEYGPQTRVYTVTAPRRNALRMLQENGNFPLLTCRIRTRANPPMNGL